MGTVTKALSVLECFSAAQPSLGLSDIARLSQLNKATAHRMLGDLQAAGFVEQHGSERAYRLGPAVLRLARLREAAVPLLDLGQAHLRALSDATGETAHLSLLQGGRLMEMAQAYSTAHPTRVMMDGIEELPLHATSSGLAVLSFAPAPFVEAALAQALARFTRQTPTTPDLVRAQIRQIRASGIARARGSFDSDVDSHAAPVFDSRAEPIGAIAVAALASRMSPARAGEIAALLRRAARDLTLDTGGCLPEPLASLSPPTVQSGETS